MSGPCRRSVPTNIDGVRRRQPNQSPTGSAITTATAVGISLGRIGERLAAITRVQVNVSAQVPIVPFILDGVRFVASLKQMTRPSIPFCIPVRIPRKPMLHAAAQIRLGSFDQRVNVIGHPAKRQHDPTTPVHFIDQPLRESRIVSFVMKKRPTPITTRYRMVDRTRKLTSLSIMISQPSE